MNFDLILNATGFLGQAAGWGGWVLAHWQDLGSLIAVIVAIYFAIRAQQWDKLLGLAAELSATTAKLAGLDNAGKRAMVAAMLYEQANPLAKRIFTPQQFELAVETAYQLITKPRLTQGNP